MNATQVEAGYQPVHREATTLRTTAIMESIGAVATLAIVGLTGKFSETVAAIATIVFGAAIWIEGGAFVASHRAEGAAERTEEWSEGAGAQFLGGLCGIVLGILALLGVAPITLVSIATLVFGATLLFSAGNQAFFGLAGLTLGLLAVCGLSSLTLVLVALACLGVSALFSGATTAYTWQWRSNK